MNSMDVLPKDPPEDWELKPMAVAEVISTDAPVNDVLHEAPSDDHAPEKSVERGRYAKFKSKWRRGLQERR